MMNYSPYTAMSPYASMGAGMMGMSNPYAASPYAAADPYAAMGIGAGMGMGSPYGGMSAMGGGMSPYGSMGGISPYGMGGMSAMGGGMSPYGMGGMDSYAASQPSQGPTQSGSFSLGQDGAVRQSGQNVHEGHPLAWLLALAGVAAGAFLLLKGKGANAEEAVEAAVEGAAPKHIEIKDGDAAAGTEAA